jgi:hypothetical protein
MNMQKASFRQFYATEAVERQKLLQIWDALSFHILHNTLPPPQMMLCGGTTFSLTLKELFITCCIKKMKLYFITV